MVQINILELIQEQLYIQSKQKEERKEKIKSSIKDILKIVVNYFHISYLKILDTMFPIKEDGEYTNTKLQHMIMMHENFKKCMAADDLQNFNGTAYKAVNAFSDMIFHGMATMRHTKNEKENNLLSVINGNQLFDKAVTLIKDCA